jgi:multidrug efflux pump subunit AcrA (membrane-fusion protein)
MKNAIQILVCIFLIFPLRAVVVYAGPGHDHGQDNSTVTGLTVDIPKRQANGFLSIPKSAQRQLLVLTEVIASAEHPRSYDLAGKVVMDPNFGGKVQAIVAGRVTPGPKGFPLPGQLVKKGEVLAYITPEAGPKGTRSLAESRLKRLRELSDTVPRKLIEEAEAALANEELRATVDGIISTTGIVSGQVVEARQLIFEVVNPNKLMVEALAYDGKLINNISHGTVSVDGRAVNLKYLGGGQALREQALPITFIADSKDLSGIPVGQPLRVIASTKDKVKGWKIPSSSVVRNSSNQSIVWVKKTPEDFEPKVVIYEPLDGIHVVVISGLLDKDRVVTKSASLINQIR